jgi:hypothetical protein
VKKYFVMEDGCDECSDDWNREGPNGGPGLRHIDLWLGGEGGSAFDAIDCEDALTHYNADNTPVMEPVVVDPPSDEPYDATPIFTTGTGACWGGAQPNTTVGQYRNQSTGTCLEAPSTGTTLKVAACAGSDAQRFTFHGAFLVIDDKCAGISGSSIVLQTCTGGPAQQWSINPDGTISDIQTSKKCFRASGTTLTAGSCSGTQARWTFTAAGNLTSTRWASKEGSASEWLRVDLGATKAVSHVKLSWEAAYGKAYSIQTSADGTNWTTIYRTTTGNGATDDLTGLAGSGRYVRMNGVTRGTSYGYSLYEMQVYGAA